DGHLGQGCARAVGCGVHGSDLLREVALQPREESVGEPEEDEPDGEGDDEPQVEVWGVPGGEGDAAFTEFVVHGGAGEPGGSLEGDDGDGDGVEQVELFDPGAVDVALADVGVGV